MSKFDLVRHYLFEMEIPIVKEDPQQEIVVIDHQERGLKNMVIDCEAPILVIEQAIMKVPPQPGDLFKHLLQWNREMVHGAFVLDDRGETVIFRDTLQLENLDRNELEASIQSLSLALAEYNAKLLKYAKQ
ncbi:MAG: YbjN domain-containing protein [Thermodesulfobacteriota bacterium]